MTKLHQHLLKWYDKNHRTLPWRISPQDGKLGIIADPYHVWLSEIMLQQTTVAAVKPYFEKFLDSWPTVEDLAKADTDHIMQAWAGLGYYSRARNLKKCADLIAQDHDGKFPETEAELQKLPGIGPYTAAAISAIAFNQPAAVVDGNIERIFSRLFAIKAPLPAAKPEIKHHVLKAMTDERPGDFAQGLMDLGSSICTPKNPQCGDCPLEDQCAVAYTDEAEIYPFKTPKKAKPKRIGAAFVIEDDEGAVFLRKRGDKGLLAGMSEVPTTKWNSNTDGATDISAAPFVADWQSRGQIRHVFTHFELALKVYHAKVDKRPDLDGWWSSPEQIDGEALPNLMRKVINAALGV